MRLLLIFFAVLFAGLLPAQLEIVPATSNPGNAFVSSGEPDVPVVQFEFVDPTNQNPPQARLRELIVLMAGNPAFGVANDLRNYISDAKLWRVASNGPVLVATALPNTNVGHRILNSLILFSYLTPNSGPIVEPGAVFHITVTIKNLGSVSASQQMQATVDPGFVLDMLTGLNTGDPVPSVGGGAVSGGTQTIDGAPAILDTTLQTTEGVAHNEQLVAAGVSQLTWSALTSLPGPAWNLSSDGVLTAPASEVLEGLYQFDVMVEDSQARSDTRTMTLRVYPPVQIVSQPTLPSGIEGLGYTTTLLAIGGVPGLNWTANGLPAGWNLLSNGLLSAGANATVPGSYTFDVTVEDTVGAMASDTFSVLIETPFVASFTQPTLPDGIAGTPYGPILFTPFFTGNPPFTWSVSGLPANWNWDPVTNDFRKLSADAGDVVQGTFFFTVTFEEATGASLSQTFNVTINAGLSITTPANLPGGTSQLPYTTTFSASGGVQPLNWSLAGAPSGWAIDPATGELSAAAGDVTAGTRQFVVTVTDSAPVPAASSGTFTVNIVPNGSPLAIDTLSLPNAVEGYPYDKFLTAVGGAPPYIWSLAGLPASVTYGNTTGRLESSMVTDAPGSYAVTASVMDSVGISATVSLTLAVLPMPQLVINSQLLPPGTRDAAYSATINASGGAAGDYTWEVSSGALPDGITGLPGTGRPEVILGGFPTTEGAWTFTVVVFDSLGNQASKTFDIAVGPPGVGSSEKADSSGCSASGGGSSLWALLLTLPLAAICRRRFLHRG